jgi:hypothetical protein
LLTPLGKFFSDNVQSADEKSAMPLKGYNMEIFRSEQNLQCQSLQCIAHVDHDISEALPHLNSLLGRLHFENSLLLYRRI